MTTQLWGLPETGALPFLSGEELINWRRIAVGDRRFLLKIITEDSSLLARAVQSVYKISDSDSTTPQPCFWHMMLCHFGK
jgi:hypothetical protein